MFCLICCGLEKSELTQYLKHIPQDGKTMQDSMSKTGYKNLLNDVGDILEAVSAIACSQTPNAEPVRKHLKMTKVDADRIVACLGALFEYANLLIRSCGLREQDIFEELKVRHMDALVNLERIWITSKRPLSEAAPDLMSIEQPAVRHRSSAASSSSAAIVLRPQDVFDTRFSHVKKPSTSIATVAQRACPIMVRALLILETG